MRLRQTRSTQGDARPPPINHPTEENGALSGSMLVPLRLLNQGYDGGDDSSLHSQLAVVAPTIATASSFKLPDGWEVERVPRSDGIHSDKYYYEPGTGHKFRSLKEVERYLAGAEYTPSRSSKGLKLSSGSRKMIVSGGMLWRLDEEEADQRQLAVVAPTIAAATSPFNLPDGWVVEEVPRHTTWNKTSDKYYYEPGTGHKFRSIKEVQRYLTGGEYAPSRSRSRSRSRKALQLGNHVESSGSRKMIASGGTLLRLDKEETNQRQLAIVAPTITAATSPFNLPDGWIVEEVPRKCHGWSDKYYYEPGTGRKFRSLSSVEKYLAEMGDNEPLSQVFKLGNRVKKFGSHKKICIEKVKTSTSDTPKPPDKINWVLADPGGSTWNPFVGESMIPEPIKQRWANRFMISINDQNFAAPGAEWQS